jgi:gluconolactonase
MMKRLLLRMVILATLTGAARPGGAAPSPDEAASPVAEAAQLQKLAGGFQFTEGATCDPEGNVFFVDQPNNRIHKWNTAQGRLSTFMDPAGRANGMCFDAHGTLFACADETNALWAVAPDKTVTTLAFQYDGKPLNGPNDVWVHPDRSLYFTDPFYPRSWWTHDKPPQDGEHVYRLSADRKTLERVAEDLVKPNGIVGTRDGKHLFVADIGAGRVYRYDIQTDGGLSGKRLFCEARSDGMTLDTDGNLYTSSEDVLVFDKTGRRVETITVPEPWVGNLCFGGKDRSTLYIAASKGLYSIRMRTRGANPGK